MATLTANQITHIRYSIGDTNTSDPHLSDAYLQYIYDNDGDSDMDDTIYFAIRALMGIAAEKVSMSNSRTGDSKSNQQWFEHLQAMEKAWGMKTGQNLGTATAGTINLGIDEEDSEYDIT
jgi:hypothetical protein